MYTDTKKNDRPRLLSISELALLVFLYGCGATNTAVNRAHNNLKSVTHKQFKLEKEYYVLLGHLEKHPTDRRLRIQQAEIKKRIIKLGETIQQARDERDLAVKEWEQRVVGSRIEKNLEEKEIRKRQYNRRRYMPR